MTPQEAVVYNLLRRSEWVCGTIFLHHYIARYGARLHALRQKGYTIEKQPCANPTHRHAGRQYQYQLVVQPAFDFDYPPAPVRSRRVEEISTGAML